MGKCSRCGCNGFKWNFVSAIQKGVSGFNASGYMNYNGVQLQGQISTMPLQDNKSDLVAYNNCKCGHHANYHS